MKYIENIVGIGHDYIDTERTDLDGEDIMVINVCGFGGCDIEISGKIMSWEDLDALKEAIAEAEKRWRNK